MPTFSLFVNYFRNHNAANKSLIPNITVYLAFLIRVQKYGPGHERKAFYNLLFYQRTKHIQSTVSWCDYRNTINKNILDPFTQVVLMTPGVKGLNDQENKRGQNRIKPQFIFSFDGSVFRIKQQSKSININNRNSKGSSTEEIIKKFQQKNKTLICSSLLQRFHNEYIYKSRKMHCQNR